MSEGGGGGKPLHNAAEVQQTGKRSFSGVWLRLPICWRFSTRRHASVDKPDTPRTSSQYDTFPWQIDALPPCFGLGFGHAASSRLCPPSAIELADTFSHIFRKTDRNVLSGRTR